jgi:hypothetical protein
MLMTLYRYLFYRLYRFSEAAPSRWWSEWKASFFLMVLEVFTAITLLGTIQILIGHRLIPKDPKSIYAALAVLLLMGIKYLVFIDRERWKKDELEFQEMSNQRKKMFNVIFWLVIIAVPSSYVIMLYVLSIA